MGRVTIAVFQIHIAAHLDEGLHNVIFVGVDCHHQRREELVALSGPRINQAAFLLNDCLKCVWC